MPSFHQPGTVLTDHVFEVPLDHADPGGDQITVFAREVVARENADRPGHDLPWLCYFQGGPGQQSPRPKGRDGWLDRALRDYRVLLLDQRGTGRSTPANRLTLAGLRTPEAQAEYLTHFRADSIVADAELIRQRLTGGAPWSVLGQSFGGFCASPTCPRRQTAWPKPSSPAGCPAWRPRPMTYTRRRIRLVAAKNAAHYERYPDDVEQASEDRRLPAQQEGPAAVGSAAHRCRLSSPSATAWACRTGSDDLHYLLEDAFDGDEIGDDFRYRAQAVLTFAGGPLYAILHEACYAQGTATRWAAQRIRGRVPRLRAPRQRSTATRSCSPAR